MNKNGIKQRAHKQTQLDNRTETDTQTPGLKKDGTLGQQENIIVPSNGAGIIRYSHEKLVMIFSFHHIQQSIPD